MLRVMQLNAGSFYEPGWERRRDEIVAWINRVAPDVICLQEIWQSDTITNTGTWLAEHADGDWHQAFGGIALPAKRSPDPSVLFGSAMLSRWPIDESELHMMTIGPSTGRPKGRTWGLLRAKTAGLDLFSVHLAPAPDETDHRQAQVLAIDELIATTVKEAPFDSHGERRPGMPVVVCGDFNAEPDSDEIRFLSGFTMLGDRRTFYQDAWRVAGDGSPGYTQDWRTNEIAADLNVHRKRIDYVFVGDAFRRTGSAGRVLSAAVICDEPLTGVLASDHFGLAVEIEWPDRPSLVEPTDGC